MSARNNESEVVGLLIRHGADVNSKNEVSTPPIGIPISDISPSHHYNNYYSILST